jgi:hypothetical protein
MRTRLAKDERLMRSVRRSKSKRKIRTNNLPGRE